MVKEGRRVVTRHFVLFLVVHPEPAPPASELTQARLGITIARKQGGAVVRNRHKRVIREAFRASRALWSAEIDVVVLVRAPLGDAGLAEVVNEWRGAAPAIARATEDALRDGKGPTQKLAPPP